jgi:hypothetical protein
MLGADLAPAPQRPLILPNRGLADRLKKAAQINFRNS